MTDNISIKTLRNLAQKLPEKIPYLKMLVLFGSRARGDIHKKSDWDFAALYHQEKRKKHCQENPFNYFEVGDILGDIFELNSVQIDVVDLNNCSLKISDRVATDGQLIYEREKGLFHKFQQKSLLTDQEKKAMRQKLKQDINDFLQEWRVIT